MSGLNQILLQVPNSTGHDFSMYKKSTIGQRVERRRAQNNIEDLAVYARYLKEHPPEVKALFKELLINVASFVDGPRERQRHELQMGQQALVVGCRQPGREDGSAGAIAVRTKLGS